MKYLLTLFSLSFFASLPIQGIAQDTSSAGQSVQVTAPEEEDGIDETDLSAQVVYQVLLAEIALQRGEVGVANQLYQELAMQTREIDTVRRAAEISMVAGQYHQALELIRIWREIEPNSRQAQQRLLQTLSLATPFDVLPFKLIEVLQEKPEFLTDNLLSLNALFARVPDRAAVYRVLQKVSEHFSGIAEAHYMLALAANEAGATQHMESEVDLALELRPDWEMPAFIKAQYLARHSGQDAIEFMQAFLKRNPDAREVQLQLARMMIAEKHYADSQVHFEQLLKIFPESPEVLYPAAILALQQGNVTDAEGYLKRLVALDISDKNRAYYYLGQIAEDKQRNDQAIDYYAKISAGDLYVSAQIRRAKLWAESGKIDLASRVLKEIKTKTSEEKIALALEQASLLRKSGRLQEAFDFLEKQSKEHPDNPELLYDTALLAEQLEKHEEMENRMRRLISIRPDNPLAYNALGYSLADRNIRLSEAREMIEKANELAPDDSYIMDSLGWVLFRQGETEKALAFLKRAYELRADPEIAAHIGEVLYTLGQKDEARQIMNRALYKEPTNEPLLDAIRKFAP